MPTATTRWSYVMRMPPRVTTALASGSNAVTASRIQVTPSGM
jgi:hypothetical protein